MIRMHTTLKFLLVLLAAAGLLFAGCEEKKEADKVENNEEKEKAEGEPAKGENAEVAPEGGEAANTGEMAGMDDSAEAGGSMEEGGMAGMDHGKMKGMAPAKAGDEKVTLVKQPGAKVGDHTMCPTMGGAFEVTDKSPVAEHNGEKVFFCCGGCEKKFAEDPDGMLTAINAEIDESNAAAAE